MGAGRSFYVLEVGLVAVKIPWKLTGAKGGLSDEN